MGIFFLVQPCLLTYCFLYNFLIAQIFNALIGNGHCNDEANNAEHSYDGGDCCGYNINKVHCSLCICHNEEVCEARITHQLVGNGFCDSKTNIEICNYDGGDCCGPHISCK